MYLSYRVGDVFRYTFCMRNKHLFFVGLLFLTACTVVVEQARVDEETAVSPPPAIQPALTSSPPTAEKLPPTETAVTPTSDPTNPRTDLPDSVKRPNMILPFDGIYPVYDPVFKTANFSPLDDEELVIGIALEGEAKAYPISVLRFREMVDDTLGETPILVTW